MKPLMFLALLFIPLNLSSYEFMKDYLDYDVEKPLPTVDSDFIYGDGSSDITTNINPYEKIVENMPIQGSIFVTHDAKNVVDPNSFRLGTKSLKTEFIKTSKMSSTSQIVVSIYSFSLDGMKIGTHTLPAINVKVAGKEIQALPLTIEVSQ